jgi:sugar lactone lactonase YvrE
MGAGPEYGTLGGGLIRFDPQTNEKRVWKDIIPAQTINGLALEPDRPHLYFSSEIYADCDSCPPTATSAEVVLFDTQNLQILKRRVFANESAVRVLCRPVEGKVLLAGAKTLYQWTPASDDLEEHGGVSGLQEIVVDTDGTLWASATGGIGRMTLSPGSNRIGIVIPEARRIRRLQIADGTLYYGISTEVVAVPIAAVPR